jgi:hypothetical protein
MKTSFSFSSYRIESPLARSPRVCSKIACAAVLLAHLTASAAVFEVNVADHILYQDPNDGDQIHLGGFSGIVPVPGDNTGSQYFVLTDRGPNADHPTIGTIKYFPVPAYSPKIVKIQLLANGTAQVLQIMNLTKPDATPMTGLPNNVTQTCTKGLEDGRNLCDQPVPTDPDGIDCEGLALDPDGSFWICEEYRPSILKVSPTGTVLFRLVPQGGICGGEQIPTIEAFPNVYSKRRVNRGFEGITVAPNGRLYTVVQRPLDNPDANTGNSSRNIRILELNPATLAIRQFVYRTEVEPAGFRQRDVYASDLSWLTPSLLVAFERKTDQVFALNIAQATDITPLENSSGTIASTGKTLEQLNAADFAASHIKPVKKAVAAVGFRTADPTLEKIEGLTIVGRTAVLCNDNDFNLAGADLTTLDSTDCDPPINLLLQSPANAPRILMTPLLEEIIFDETD